MKKIVCLNHFSYIFSGLNVIPTSIVQYLNDFSFSYRFFLYFLVYLIYLFFSFLLIEIDRKLTKAKTRESYFHRIS